MKYGLILLAVLCGCPVFGQLGVAAHYNFNDHQSPIFVGLPDLEPVDMGNTYEVQVNYWFRLKNKRVEFTPTVYYGRGGIPSGDVSTRYTEAGFQFEVNVYPFDFGGDCDCPTFGKQGPHLEKGFFLQAFPGIANRSISFASELAEDVSNVTFIYGGGIGLDIGITNFLTVTPTATVRAGRSPYVQADGISPDGEVVYVPDDRLTSYQLGLQATFRFDHKRY